MKNKKKEQNNPKKYADNLKYSLMWLTSDAHDSTRLKNFKNKVRFNAAESIKVHIFKMFFRL